jgi:hypothetical protein
MFDEVFVDPDLSLAGSSEKEKGTYRDVPN